MLCMVVMEFCTNGNLTDFLEKTDPDKMSDEDRVKLALDICNVMNHIHSLNKVRKKEEKFSPEKTTGTGTLILIIFL